MSSETDASGLWPKADTLAAGDEELLVEPSNDDAEGYAYFAEESLAWAARTPQPELGDLEDGHLENDDWRARHPGE